MKGLYLGDQESAADIDQIKKHKITHILSMIGGKPIFEVYLAKRTIQVSNQYNDSIYQLLFSSSPSLSLARS